MPIRIPALLAMACCFTGLVSSAMAQRQDRVEVFVWPKGDDANDGSKSSPKRTLAAAIEQVRGNGRPTVIWMAGGVYPIKSPVMLSRADSRTADAPLVITTFNRKKPAVLTGGVRLANDAWRPVGSQDRLVNQLSPPARSKVQVCELSGSPLSGFFKHRPDPDEREHAPLLVWSGYVLQQSRWPNRGYAYLDKVLAKGPTTRWLKANEKPAAYSFEKPTGGSFTLKQSLDFERLASEFNQTGDMRVEGYLHNDWFFQREMLGGVHSAKRSLQLVRYTRYGIEQKLKLPRRMRLINTITYLDQPGEWYFDHQEKKLYLMPVEPPGDRGPAVQIIGDQGLITAADVQHVTIRGLTFEGFGGTGVFFDRASHITIAGCEFRAAAGGGARVQGGTHNTITGCDFHDLNGGFVMKGVEANRRTLTREHNRATNNHIWDCRARHYGGGASVSGVGFLFAHNVIRNMQAGLGYSGCNDLVAEYNEFANLGYEMGDWNAVYAGADLSLQNNVFRYNLFHHFIETPGAHPIAAIRADDGASGLKVESNIFFKTGRAAVQFHGPNCSMTNNFVMRQPHLLWTVQQPSDGKTSQSQFMKNKLNEKNRVEREVAGGTRNANDKANIIGRAEAVFGKEGWKTNQAWIDKYPNFADHFDFNKFERSPWAQSFAYVKDNLIDKEANPFPFHFHGRKPSDSPDAAKKFLPKTAKFWTPYPLEPARVFQSPGTLDFRFRNSRLPKGVKKFNFKKVGLVADKHRPNPPDKTEYRRAIATQYRRTSSHRQELDLAEINRRYSAPAYLEKNK